MYFQMVLQRFVPVILPPATGRGPLGLHDRLLGSGHKFPSCFVSHHFLPQHASHTAAWDNSPFPPQNDAPMLLCLCIYYFSPSPLCENIRPLSHPLTLEFTLCATGNFYVLFKTQLRYPFSCFFWYLLLFSKQYTYTIVLDF